VLTKKRATPKWIVINRIADLVWYQSGPKENKMKSKNLQRPIDSDLRQTTDVYAKHTLNTNNANVLDCSKQGNNREEFIETTILTNPEYPFELSES